jgi:hypothetical protein
MAMQASKANALPAPARTGLLKRAVEVLGAWLTPRPNRLDIEAVSDDVKRDLGILDGRQPYREDPSTQPWR